MSDWIIAIGIVILIVFISLKGNINRKKLLNKNEGFYKKNIASDIFIILLVFILSHNYFQQLDFQKIGKGFIIDVDIISVIVSIFVAPFFLTLLFKNYLYPKDIASAKVIFGYPVNYLPNSNKEFLWFSISIITGVIFE